MTDVRDRVLLLRHRGAPETWGTPGGGHEPGERLDETACREVREETGIDPELTGIYRARRKEVVNGADPDERFYMLTVEFEAVAERTAIDVGDPEVLEARWFADPPDRVAEYLAGAIADAVGDT